MTVVSELGEGDERVGAAIGLEDDAEDVLAGMLAEVEEGTSLTRFGFGRGSVGVGGSGES